MKPTPEILAKLAARATRQPNWTGWVYSDHYGRCFESVYEFMYQFYEDMGSDPFLEQPPFVWATKSRPIAYLDFNDVLRLITDSLPEGVGIESVRGLDKLKAGIDEFNAANSEPVHRPDRTIIVPLQWDHPSSRKSNPPKMTRLFTD